MSRFVARLMAALCLALAAVPLAQAGVSAPPYSAFSDSAALTAAVQRIGGLQTTLRSTNNAATIFTNAGAGFVEPWANITQWASTGTPTQVSSGNLYANAAGAGSGMNHAWAICSTCSAKAEFTVNIASGTGSGGLIIGVNKDTAGVAPTASANASFGLQFFSAGGASCILNGTATSLSGSVQGGGTYKVDVIVDPVNVSVVANLTGALSATQFRCKQARSGFTVNNLYVFNSDTRALTGNSIGPGWSKNYLTSGGASAPEGVWISTQWSGDSAGNPFKIETPANYDPRAPAPWAMCFHGNGTDENFCSDNSNMQPLRSALLQAGYIVITATANGVNGGWGFQNSLDAYYAAYQFAKEHYALGPGVFVANSMGGIESELLLASGRIPGVVAQACFSCTYSLWDNYINIGSSAGGFLGLINSVYGVSASTLAAVSSAGATTLSSNASYAAGTVLAVGAAQGYGHAELDTVQSVSGSGPYTITLTRPATYSHASGDSISDYGTKTAGHDPSTLSCSSFRGIPFAIYTATDDTAVNPTNNGFALASCLAGASANVFTAAGITGGHGFTFSPYATGSPTYNPGSPSGSFSGLGGPTGAPTPKFRSMVDFLNAYTGN